MAATTAKNDPIRNDKMSFRTQLVDGKPQIFFDPIDAYATNTRSKRTGRTLSNASRLAEHQTNRVNTSKLPAQNGTNKPTTKPNQTSNKLQGKDEAASLGVYMTMDELAELVKAVKENAKSETKTSTEEVQQPSPPQPQETTAPIVPKLELPVEPPAPPSEPHAPTSPRDQGLGLMADRKRQKWLREKAEIEKMQMEIQYDQLKHQLSPRHKQPSVSPERSTFQYDFPPPPHKPPPAPPTNKPPPVPPPSNQNGFHHEVPPKVTEDITAEGYKTRLMDQKQQQWKQENAEKTTPWNPFGRPGAGAPNSENHARMLQPPSNPMLPYRAPAAPMQTDRSLSSVQPGGFVYSDQSRVPAAMRTNLLFGDVRFDDDVRTAKELERRQWLDDLDKQVDDNKRHKTTRQEVERRKDFLNENIRPLLQEAEQRRQQPNGTSPIKNSNQDSNPYSQQALDKSFDGTDAGQNDRRAQLMDKLKRNGFQTDNLAKTQSTVPSTNQRTGEKLFGPDYEVTSRQNNPSRIDALHLNANVDPQHSYRPHDLRRGEAVNTVDVTFRSDHNGHSEMRIPSRRQLPSQMYEDSELPPRGPNPHFQNSGYRSVPNQPGKNNPRMRSIEENPASRRNSSTTYHSNPNDDRTISQISQSRSNQPPLDINQRPLWNYKNPQHREYVPNSKRDPHYEKRQRMKHFQQGNFDRIDDVQKKTCYNRWNSDSELQNQQRKSLPANRIHSTMSKATSHGNHKDESIMNLLKMQHKQQQRQAVGARKSALHQPRTDEESFSNHESSFDKYDNYVPYTRTDDVLDQGQVQSFSRETTPRKQTREVNGDWNDNNQSYSDVQQYQPPPPPQSRQEHILNQLSAIKENLIRRQRQLAS